MDMCYPGGSRIASLTQLCLFEFSSKTQDFKITIGEFHRFLYEILFQIEFASSH